MLEVGTMMHYIDKRRSRTTGAGMTWWRWGLGWDTLAEYTDPDSDGDIEGFSKFNVMMGMMHPLAEATVPSGQPPANATYSYLALDHLSSTRAVFSQAKVQTGAMEFFPYGGRLSTSGTLPHHQFTAKPYDTGTGQYYFPYRYYAPAMARWTAADPAGTVDGPNVYGYVQNSPIISIDVLGLLVRLRWQCVEVSRGSFCPKPFRDYSYNNHVNPCTKWCCLDTYKHCDDWCDYIGKKLKKACGRDPLCKNRVKEWVTSCYLACDGMGPLPPVPDDLPSD